MPTSFAETPLVSMSNPGSRLRKEAGKVYRTLARGLLDVRARPFELTQRKCIVLAPHPDDETLGCGGLIMAKRKLGVPVEVVYLTDGEFSRPNHISMEAFGAMRRNEALGALGVLGIERSAIHFLQFPDNRLSTLSPAMLQDMRTQLGRFIQPGTQVFFPFRGEGLSDHDALWGILEGMPLHDVLLCEYFVWSLWARPNLLGKLGALRRLDHGMGKIKREALAHHVTQRGLAREMVDACTRDHELFFVSQMD